MTGYVMNIQKFSVNDGDGIRTSIFLAGCPLRCKWCSNPEGQTFENQLTKRMSVSEIAEQIYKDDIFYRNSNGGITFTGGEATCQLDFLQSLTDEFYDANYNLALETCGYFSFEKVLPVLKKMNLIFMDLKLFDSELHKKFTGKENNLILENIEKTSVLCDATGIEFIIRIPVIEGVNADEKNIRDSVDFIVNNSAAKKIEILSYHKYGELKYESLKLPVPDSNFKVPSNSTLNAIKEIITVSGLELVEYR